MGNNTHNNCPVTEGRAIPDWLVRDPGLALEARDMSEADKLSFYKIRSYGLVLRATNVGGSTGDSGVLKGDYAPKDSADEGTQAHHVERHAGKGLSREWTRIIVGDVENGEGYFIQDGPDGPDGEAVILRVQNGEVTDEVVPGDVMNQLADDLLYNLDQNTGINPNTYYGV